MESFHNRFHNFPTHILIWNFDWKNCLICISPYRAISLNMPFLQGIFCLFLKANLFWKSSGNGWYFCSLLPITSKTGIGEGWLIWVFPFVFWNKPFWRPISDMVGGIVISPKIFCSHILKLIIVMFLLLDIDNTI